MGGAGSLIKYKFRGYFRLFSTTVEVDILDAYLGVIL